MKRKNDIKISKLTQKICQNIQNKENEKDYYYTDICLMKLLKNDRRLVTKTYNPL